MVQHYNPHFTGPFGRLRINSYFGKGKAGECRSLPVHNTARRVQADQEDGAVEVRISSGDPTPPNLWGTPLFICYMSLSH